MKVIAQESLELLRFYIEKERYEGFDPYDALNSPLIKFLAPTKYSKIFFIQLFKKLPINLRKFVSIKKEYNPKGLGLILWGYSKLYYIQKDRSLLDQIHVLIELLCKAKSPGYSGNCWGYNFDWQSRAFFLPKYTPTTVNSSFVGHALIDTYKYTGIEKALEMALSIKDFIINDLNRLTEEDCLCFSYSPLDKTYVHNANLLGSSLLIRLNEYSRDEKLEKIALSSLGYTQKYQRTDGSWFYAEPKYQNWIDSFHTGFNLQSLLYFIEAGYGQENFECFERALEFYARSFFLKDGTPKYYHDNRYPLDIHSASQALVVFSRTKTNPAVLNAICAWMIRNMKDKKGYFYFQKNRYFTNRISYMRWSQAWAFHALSDYLVSGL